MIRFSGCIFTWFTLLNSNSVLKHSEGVTDEVCAATDGIYVGLEHRGGSLISVNVEARLPSLGQFKLVPSREISGQRDLPIGPRRLSDLPHFPLS